MLAGLEDLVSCEKTRWLPRKLCPSPTAQAPELGSGPRACPQLGQELWAEREEASTEGWRTGGPGSHTAPSQAGSADQTVR